MLLVRRAICALLGALVLTHSASSWAVISISPSVSSNGSYTVSWSSGFQSAWQLEERFNSGSWNVLSDPANGATSKAFSGKAPGTYTYRIRWWNSGDNAWEFIEGPASVTVIPSVPTGLAIDSATNPNATGDFSVSWNASAGATSYDLHEKFVPNAWTEPPTNTANTSVSLSGKSDGTWRYRVRACNGASCSAWSSTTEIDVDLVPTPTGLSISNPSPNITGTFTVSWSGTNATTFELKESTTGGNPYSAVQNTSAQNWTVPAPGKSVGTYYYKVRGCNGASSCGEFAGPISIQVTTPPVPTGFSLSPEPNQPWNYSIDWNIVTGASSYELQEKINGGAWGTVQNTSALSKAYSNKGIGSYEYRVRACSYPGCSTTWSATQSHTVTPSAVTNLVAPAASTSSSVQLTWSATTPTPSSYEIETTRDGVVNAINTSSSSTSHTLTNVANGTNQFRVRGCAGAICGGWSNVQTTLVSAPDTTATAPSTSYPSDIQETAGADFFGVVRGEHDVTASGAATYSIPIEVPPGTNGMHPSLSLSYSSHNRSGLAGLGWGLSGVGLAITRCGQNMVENDDVVHGVDWTANDRFCYGDQQLVVVNSGTYGEGGTEYRTRIDGLARFVSHGPLVGDAPAYFTMEAKNGIKMEFGNSASSFIEATGRTKAARWLLNRVEDTTGNYYVIVYDEDEVNGEFRPLSIKYTAHTSQEDTPTYYAKVAFSYEDRNAAEQVIQYRRGSQMRQSKRLTSIKVSAQDLVNGSYTGTYADVREYVLAYEANAVGAQDYSRLASIKMCAPNASGDCTMTTTFAWHAEGTGYTSVSNWSAHSPNSNNNAMNRWADLNGDGRLDYVTTLGTAGASHYVSLAKSSWSGSGNGYLSQSTWTAHAKGSGMQQLVDLNGDGRADYVTTNTGSNGTQYWSLSTGIGYQSAQTLTSGINVQASDIEKFVDMDGDSLPDYVRVRGTDFQVALNATTGTSAALSTAQTWTVGLDGPDLSAQGISYGFHDVDLDGRADVVIVTNKVGGGTSHNVHFNNGSGFDSPVTWSGHPNSTTGGQWADINGDGLLDYINIDGTTHYISMNKGGGYESLTWTTAQSVGGGIALFRDINGDGLADFITMGGSNYNQHYISFSTASGYVNSTWAAVQMGSSNGYDFIDLNGDGMLDYATVDTNGTHRIRINNSEPLHLMTGVTSGLGLDTTFAYKPLTDSSVYTKGSGATFPTMDVISGLYVVSGISHEDGIGGTLDATYTYEGLRHHRQGWGSLGFSKVTVTDLDRNTQSVTLYSQTWPFIGSATSAKVYVTTPEPDRLISDTTYTHAQKATATADVVFPYVNVEERKVYDLATGANPIVETSISQNGNSFVDGYGNFLKTTSVVKDKVHSTQPMEFTTTVERTFKNTETSTVWLTGFLTQEVIKQDVSGQTHDASKDRTTAFQYDGNTTNLSKGQLTKQIREPGLGAPVELVIDYTYDAFGNRVTETAYPAASPTESREEAVSYEPNYGRFPVLLTNAMEHETQVEFDQMLGVLTSITDPNGLVTTRDYDAFGRMVEEDRPDGTVTTIGYYRSSGVTTGVPTNAKLHVDTKSTGNTRVRTFLDVHGRTLRTRVLGFAGQVSSDIHFVNTDTEYDGRGRVARTSEPYYDFGTPSIKWNTPTYDDLNRVTGVAAADAAKSAGISYSNFTVTNTDAGQRKSISTKNALGQLLTVVQKDASNVTTSSMRYGYDTAGNLTTITKDDGGSLQNVVTNSYDRLGRKTSIVDPDAGTTTFSYNEFGELKTQTTPELAAASKTLSMDYDELGRPVTRVEPENSADFNDDLVTNWFYDDVTSGNLGIGRLTKETTKLDSEAQNSFERTYLYGDQAGHLTAVATAIWTPAKGARTHDVSITYDTEGRVSTVTYPRSPSFPSPAEPFKVRYAYNARGYLEQMHERVGTTDTALLYQVEAVDAQGRITQQYLGDTSLNARGYEGSSGRLTFTNASIHASNNNGTQLNVQNLIYTYDAVGNLASRSDLLQSLTETFTYDALDRLRTAQVAGQGVVNYDYDVLGNVSNKEDHGNPYTYGGTRPHAVTQVLTPSPGSQTLAYTYNANGNQLTADLPDSTTREVAWTTYDLPREISIDGTSTQRVFRYGPDRARYVQEATDASAVTSYTDYVGEMSVRTLTGTDEVFKHYLFANGQRIGVLVDEKPGGGAATKAFRYFHQDHLGSVTAIIDKPGASYSVERLSYDAFGQRRDGQTWVGPAAAATEERGYTGHEHLEDVALIHMNGRVYDPGLGRMLSPDPLVSSPLFGQNWNRYSYVLNNPLRYTDPSGFMPSGCDLDTRTCVSSPFHPAPEIVMGGYNPAAPYPMGELYMPTMASAYEAAAEVLVWGMLTGAEGAREAFREWHQLLHEELPEIFGPDPTDPCPPNGCVEGPTKPTVKNKKSPPSSATAGNVAPNVGDSASTAMESIGLPGAGRLALTAASLSEIPVISQAAGLIDAGISASEGDWTGAGLGVLGIVPGIGSIADATRLGRVAARGGSAAVRTGQAGEALVRASVYIGPEAKTAIEVAGRTRIPDGLTGTVLSEVKNVGSLSYTQQLRDFAQFARDTGRRFDLYVRPDTQLSGPLRAAEAAGDIRIVPIPEL